MTYPQTFAFQNPSCGIATVVAETPDGTLYGFVRNREGHEFAARWTSTGEYISSCHSAHLDLVMFDANAEWMKLDVQDRAILDVLVCVREKFLFIEHFSRLTGNSVTDSMKVAYRRLDHAASCKNDRLAMLSCSLD